MLSLTTYLISYLMCPPQCFFYPLTYSWLSHSRDILNHLLPLLLPNLQPTSLARSRNLPHTPSTTSPFSLTSSLTPPSYPYCPRFHLILFDSFIPITKLNTVYSYSFIFGRKIFCVIYRKNCLSNIQSKLSLNSYTRLLTASLSFQAFNDRINSYLHYCTSRYLVL